MTTRETEACVICMNVFDATTRQTVALPCGHNFCLTCLVRLKASGSPVCPQCRQSFAEVELPGLSRMAKASGKSDFMKKEKLVGCKVHKEPFVYWSTRSNELYCTTCMLSADINTSCLKRISDAIPIIQEDLERKAQVVKKGIAGDLANHKEERKKAVQELAKIITFEKSILKLKADYQQFIEKVDSHNSKLREKSASVNKIEENISEIHGEKDIGMVLSYCETLNELQKTFACQQHEINPERCVDGARSRHPKTSCSNRSVAVGSLFSLSRSNHSRPGGRPYHDMGYYSLYPANVGHYLDTNYISHIHADKSGFRKPSYSSPNFGGGFGDVRRKYEAPISNHDRDEHIRRHSPQRKQRLLAIEYDSFESTDEAPISNRQVQHMKRPARLLSDIACVFEEGEGQEAAFIQKLQQEMQLRKNRSMGSSSHKIDVECVD